jgi:hypothetical protein
MTFARDRMRAIVSDFLRALTVGSHQLLEPLLFAADRLFVSTASARESGEGGRAFPLPILDRGKMVVRDSEQSK